MGLLDPSLFDEMLASCKKQYLGGVSLQVRANWNEVGLHGKDNLLVSSWRGG